MEGLITEKIASYIYDKSVAYGIYNVFACYHNMENYNNLNIDFYEVYDDSGLCVSEGEPFYQFPSWSSIYYLCYIPAARRYPGHIVRGVYT
jgi:hypothetical protein